MHSGDTILIFPHGFIRLGVPGLPHGFIELVSPDCKYPSKNLRLSAQSADEISHRNDPQITQINGDSVWKNRPVFFLRQTSPTTQPSPFVVERRGLCQSETCQTSGLRHRPGLRYREEPGLRETPAMRRRQSKCGSSCLRH